MSTTAVTVVVEKSGNRMTRDDDYHHMQCAIFREALSATLDGETPALDEALVRAHLRRCAACREWERGAVRLRATVSAAVAAEVVAFDVSADLSGAILHRLRPASRRARWTARARVGLVVVAVLHVLVAVPAIVGASAHPVAELGAWDAALATGFLFAAARPARAWGMLPLVAALVAALLTTSLVNTPTTDAELARETTHLLDVAGLVCLWAVAGAPLPHRLRPWAA